MIRKRVELPAPPGNRLETAERVAESDLAHARLLAALAPADRPAADLQRTGVRKTAAYAEALGWAALPEAEQRVLVKKAKDRVNKARLRLERD